MPTVTVKIAVAVDREGNWNSCGGSGMKDDDKMGLAIDAVNEGERRYWLTATLELPVDAEPPLVSADVEKA